MKINFYELDKLSERDRARLIRRAEDDIDQLRGTVQPIIDDVRDRGDGAL
ncbi:MAG: hypothetical protein JO284_15125, partial [Planctomycetaceae bacterium]|nr:hypothetical protein [Planctomycetaceae bacterium]